MSIMRLLAYGPRDIYIESDLVRQTILRKYNIIIEYLNNNNYTKHEYDFILLVVMKHIIVVFHQILFYIFILFLLSLNQSLFCSDLIL